MSLSEQEKLKLVQLIKANKWYTYDEAEGYLRKHWNSDYDETGDYLSMKRSQIQKILRSDIIGTYLEINKRKKNQSDEDWFKESVYGWSKKEIFYLDDEDEEKEYNEILHVFPKYDRLFIESELQQSIILSSFDVKLNDVDKIQLREVYEELYGAFGKGKTLYLMTEPYLFALKHEVERREFPTKRLYLKPKSPKEIKLIISQCSNQEERQIVMMNLIDEFIQKVNEEVYKYQSARDVEKKRFEEIISFFKNWNFGFYSTIIQKIEDILENEGFLDGLYSIYSELEQPFKYSINVNSIKEKVNKKHEQLVEKSLTGQNLAKELKKIIYSIEKYNLEKLEIELSKDNKFLGESATFRHQISKRLHQILREMGADPLLVDSLNNAGIHED